MHAMRDNREFSVDMGRKKAFHYRISMVVCILFSFAVMIMHANRLVEIIYKLF